MSIRNPISGGRASIFNQHSIGEFINNLGDVLLEHSILPSRLWNLDETGVSTILKPRKIVDLKGVNQVVYAEQGTLVTVVLAASAAGNHVQGQRFF